MIIYIMNKNKLNELDKKLQILAETHMLTLITNENKTKNKKKDDFIEINIDTIVSNIVKGDYIKAICKNINNKNLSGYLIDCVVLGNSEYNIVICVPTKTYKKFMTLSSNDYEFYFKHRISKNKSNRELFISLLNN
jgi:hypothetical protein